MAVKTTDPVAHKPKTVVPYNPERKKMKKADAVEDSRRLRERDARKEAAGKDFDNEEAIKAAAKKKAVADKKAEKERIAKEKKDKKKNKNK